MIIYVKDTDSFIKKSKLIWGDNTLDYSKVKYVDAKTPVILICKKCNTAYSQQPPNHWRAVGCLQCFKNAVSKQHKGKNISEKNKKLYTKNMLKRWESEEYRKQMIELTDSFINRNHICRFCGTVENLIPKRRIKKGTLGEEPLYRNICYDCNNSRKKKGACKHCGTTKNLMTHSIMNQHMNISRVVTQDVCKHCFSELTRKTHTGRKKSIDQRKKISGSVKKLWKEHGISMFTRATTQSKPQVELYKIAKMFFPDARDDMNIETSISRRYPDIVIPSLSLIVEYDGSYWHSEEEDAKRDKELNNVGYSIIHFIDKVPNMLTFFGYVRQAVVLKESVLRVS